MSSIVGRSAFRATRPLRSAAADAAEKQLGKDALRKGAKKDPELYVLFGVMAGAFGLAGWYFSRSPTSATSETAIAKAKDSEPWKTGLNSKYQYHPGGDLSAPKKDAPSALNAVVVPSVNLPKDLHERFNKYGKDEY